MLLYMWPAYATYVFEAMIDIICAQYTMRPDVSNYVRVSKLTNKPQICNKTFLLYKMKNSFCNSTILVSDMRHLLDRVAITLLQRSVRAEQRTILYISHAR